MPISKNISKTILLTLLFLLCSACSNTQKASIKKQNTQILKDNPLTFKNYVTQMRVKISRNWSMPNGHKNSKVTVLLRIDEYGNLISSDILKTSGYNSLDQSVLDAISKSAPFTDAYRNIPKELIHLFKEVEFNFEPH